MAEPRPSRLAPIILIVLVVAAAGVGAGVLYEFNHPKPTPAVRTVAIGDNVTVNYIGLFGSTPQVGRVFDTSLYAVATNNVSYPKSLEFSYRGSASQYVPLGVHVGPSAPSGGYSIGGVTFGSVVPGFWQGLLGLPVNHTSWVTFPASLGYGAQNPSCLVTKPLTLTVPTVTSLSPHDFASAYPGINATAGTTFTDPTYGWSDLIFSANATAVVVQNLPAVGFTVPGTAWPEVVTAITATSISVQNRLSAANAGLVAGKSSGAGTCGTTQFIVSTVDSANGTYTENFNREVVGASLTFEITVVQFY